MIIIFTLNSPNEASRESKGKTAKDRDGLCYRKCFDLGQKTIHQSRMPTVPDVGHLGCVTPSSGCCEAEKLSNSCDKNIAKFFFVLAVNDGRHFESRIISRVFLKQNSLFFGDLQKVGANLFCCKMATKQSLLLRVRLSDCLSVYL